MLTYIMVLFGLNSKIKLDCQTITIKRLTGRIDHIKLSLIFRPWNCVLEPWVPLTSLAGKMQTYKSNTKEQMRDHPLAWYFAQLCVFGLEISGGLLKRISLKNGHSWSVRQLVREKKMITHDTNLSQMIDRFEKIETHVEGGEVRN